jgi:hypothetical protein
VSGKQGFLSLDFFFVNSFCLSHCLFLNWDEKINLTYFKNEEKKQLKQPPNFQLILRFCSFVFFDDKFVMFGGEDFLD